MKRMSSKKDGERKKYYERCITMMVDDLSRIPKTIVLTGRIFLRSNPFSLVFSHMKVDMGKFFPFLPILSQGRVRNGKNYLH